MEILKIVQELLGKKAKSLNKIDLNVYASGLFDMYEALQTNNSNVNEQICTCSTKICSNGSIKFSMCRKCHKEMFGI